jgi:hypothetical protein
METMMRLILATATVAAAMSFDVPASYAFGDAPWCMVKNLGSDVAWDCQFNSAQQCAPAVIAGDRSFCNMNPAWRGPATSTVASPPKHNKQQAQEH